MVDPPSKANLPSLITGVVCIAYGLGMYAVHNRAHAAPVRPQATTVVAPPPTKPKARPHHKAALVERAATPRHPPEPHQAMQPTAVAPVAAAPVATQPAEVPRPVVVAPAPVAIQTSRQVVVPVRPPIVVAPGFAPGPATPLYRPMPSYPPGMNGPHAPSQPMSQQQRNPGQAAPSRQPNRGGRR